MACCGRRCAFQSCGALLVVLLVIGGTAVAWFKHTFPTPPLQTEVQKEVFASKSAQAKIASEAATAEVLAFFNSSDFRSAIHDCCPEAAAMSPHMLLERFRAEARVGELAHAFPSSVSGLFVLGIMTSLFSFFLNDWHAMLIIAPFTPNMNRPEVGIFGCLPFATGDTGKPTWQEASDRMLYIAHNMRQMDTGSAPNFGDISVILRPTRLKDAVLISAVDSGAYELECNNTARCVDDVDHSGHIVKTCAGGKNHCDALPPSQASVVGTLEYMDHLILSNLGFFIPTDGPGSDDTIFDAARQLFRRTAFAGSYLTLAPTNIQEANRYWEANILANTRFDEDMKFFVASFANLFGTADGQKLRALTSSRSWPLVWSFGTGNDALLDHDTVEFAGNRRILDPASTMTNASFPQGASSHFEAMWSAVGKARAKGSRSYAEFWKRLEPHQLRVAPLTALACDAHDVCLGTATATNDCICTAPLSKLSSQGPFGVQPGNPPLVALISTSVFCVFIAVLIALRHRRSQQFDAMQEPLLD